MQRNGNPVEYRLATKQSSISEPRNSDGEGSRGPELLREMLECRRYGTTPDAVLQQRQGSRPQGQCQPNTQRKQWQFVRSNQGLALSPDWRTYVSEPVLCRGNDGLSGRVDRLRALGNAVVPHVAMIPLARILELNAG